MLLLPFIVFFTYSHTWHEQIYKHFTIYSGLEQLKSEFVNSTLKKKNHTYTNPFLSFKTLPAQRAKKLRLPKNTATSHDFNTQVIQINFFRPFLCDKKNGLVTTYLVISYNPQELYEVGFIYKPPILQGRKMRFKEVKSFAQCERLGSFGIMKKQSGNNLLLSKLLECSEHNLVIPPITL